MATIRKREYRDRETKRKTGEGWAVRVKLRSHVHYETFPTQREAKAWAGNLEAAIRHGTCTECPSPIKTESTPKSEPTVRKLFEEYQNSAAFKKLRPATQTGAKESLNWLVKNGWGDLHPQDVTRGFLARFREEHIKAGKSAARHNRLLQYARQAFAHAWDLELIQTNPLANFKRIEGETKRERIPTAKELEAMGKSLPGWFLPLFRFLSACPVRIRETLSLTWRDVDTEKGTVRFRAETTKSKRERTVPLILFPEVLQEMKARKGFALQPVFPREDGKPMSLDYAERIWIKARKAAQVKDLRLHDLRHRAITSMRAQNIPDALITYSADHALPAAAGITGRYIHLTADHWVEEAAKHVKKQS